MPRPVHQNWAGYTPVYDNLGKHIVAAQCDSCNKTMKKRDSEALLCHKKVCKGKTESPQVINIENTSQRMPLRTMSTNNNSTNRENTENCSFNDKDNAAQKRSSTQEMSPMKSPRLSSTDRSICTQSCDSKTKDILFLKFLLYYNIDFNKVNSGHCHDMIKAFDPSYRVPSSEELKTRILKDAIDQTNLEKVNDLTNAMGVITVENDNKLIAIAFAIAGNKEYVYINNDVIGEAMNDYRDKIESFCKVSVEKAKRVHNIIIKYILYDGNTQIHCEGKINDEKYYILHSFKKLINDLKYNHEPFVLASIDDTAKVLEYSKALTDYQKKFDQSNYTQADAIEDLFKLVSTNILSINPSWNDVILVSLSPVALAANYFVHKYKGHYFANEEGTKSLYEMMYKFLFAEAPDKSFDSLAKYKDSSSDFKILIDNAGDYTSERFWHCASVYHKDLSSFALQLVNLPASLRQIDLVELNKAASKSYMVDNEASTAFLISLFLN